MLAAIRMALKYKGYVDIIPVAIDLITDMEKSISNDGKLSRKEQSRLMTKFHALIKEIKIQRKVGKKAA